MTDSNEVASTARSAKAQEAPTALATFLEPRTQLDECPELVVGDLRQRKRGLVARPFNHIPITLITAEELVFEQFASLAFRQ